MDAEQDRAGEGTRNGGADRARPVPRDTPRDDGTTAGEPSRPPDGPEDPTKAIGPAEEQDRETADSRGLTTDTAPGD